jgi:hypothetical protein
MTKEKKKIKKKCEDRKKIKKKQYIIIKKNLKTIFIYLREKIFFWFLIII